MPLRPGLLAQIKSTLGPAIAPSLNATSAGSDIFEAYVFSIVLQAARDEGATIQFRNIDNSPVTLFTFRTSPGHLWSTAHPYTYAVVDFPGLSTLEVHLGVYVLGASKVMHEADVAVLTQAAAETSRRGSVPPHSKDLIVAAECKFYSTNLKLGLAREFIGLCADMPKPKSVFITNSESDSVQKLLTKKAKMWEHRILPGAYEVGRLLGKFRDAFQAFRNG